MAASAWTFYDSFMEAIGDGTIDLDTHTFKVALFTSSYTPTVASDTLYSGLTGEVANGNGYTTGGVTLGSVTWAQTSGTAKFDSADPSWTASGGSIVARYAVLYDSNNSALVAYTLLDTTPANVTVTDGNTLTLQLHANGFFTLTEA